jgi:hypothetical protein
MSWTPQDSHGLLAAPTKRFEVWLNRLDHFQLGARINIHRFIFPSGLEKGGCALAVPFYALTG